MLREDDLAWHPDIRVRNMTEMLELNRPKYFTSEKDQDGRMWVLSVQEPESFQAGSALHTQ